MTTIVYSFLGLAALLIVLYIIEAIYYAIFGRDERQ